jgi:hypothetical protein
LLVNKPINQFSTSNSGVQHTGVTIAACYLLQLVSLSGRQVGSLPFQRRGKDVRQDWHPKRDVVVHLLHGEVRICKMAIYFWSQLHGWVKVVKLAFH